MRIGFIIVVLLFVLFDQSASSSSIFDHFENWYFNLVVLSRGFERVQQADRLAGTGRGSRDAIAARLAAPLLEQASAWCRDRP